jgi:hypothetical protein
MNPNRRNSKFRSPDGNGSEDLSVQLRETKALVKKRNSMCMEARMTKFGAMTAVALLALGLSGCGTDPFDRTVSGAGIGAGVGALGAAATGGSVGTGAVIGGVVGGVVGAATSSDDVYLGEPVWRKRCLERRRNGERVDCSRPPR